LIKPVNEHLKIQNKDHSPFAHLLNIIKNKNYRIAFTTTALLSVGGYLMMPFGSAFAVNNLKLQQSQLPLIFMCTGVSSLIIMPLVGRLSDKIDKFKIFVFASIWASVFVIIYTNLGPTSISYVIPLNILLFMGIMSRMIPAGALTTSIPELKDRGGFMSLNGSLQQITGGVATLLAGFIIVQKDKNSPLDNYPMLGYIGVFFMVLCVFMLWRVNKIIKVQGHR
jgi:predicted MFS family arabinose efflux permease